MGIVGTGAVWPEAGDSTSAQSSKATWVVSPATKQWNRTDSVPIGGWNRERSSIQSADGCPTSPQGCRPINGGGAPSAALPRNVTSIPATPELLSGRTQADVS